MFARKMRVWVEVGGGERKECPLEWLDAFAMRNFTGAAEFDDTLPVGEGRIEAGLSVKPERLRKSLEDWLNKTGKGGGKKVKVEIEEEGVKN
jgi:hypothetical protein